MAKQPKQQVLSRFFSPKPPPSASAQTQPPNPPPPKPSPSTVASFSHAKRGRALSRSPKPPAKKPKPKPNPNPNPSPPNPDAVRRRLLEPPPPCPNPTAAAAATRGYTPLEQQVVDLKARHPGILLMVEVGYRFRFFGEDAAAAAASVLGIVAHPDRSFLTASVPTFRLGFHVRRLVDAGHRVGVVRQTETAAIKAAAAARGETGAAPFARELSAVYTRATIEAAAGEMEGGGEPEEGSRYLVCVVDKEVETVGREGFEVKVGVVAIEVSTGEVVHGEFMDNASRSGLEAVLLDLAPVEVILGTPLSFATEKGVMAMPELVVQAMALSVRYLKGFGMARLICFGSSFRPFSANTEMSLSANALQQLEVLKNNSDGSTEGSLFRTMNNTCTAFGSRLFRHWLTHPLCDRNLIRARHDAVSEISESMGSRQDSFVGVIQAILTAGKQLKKLVIDNTDTVSSQHKTIHSSLLRKQISTASSSFVLANSVKLLSCLSKDAADQGDMLNLFIASVDQFPEVAEGHVAVEMAKRKLDILIVEYRKQLGMCNLEYKTIAGTPYLIEVKSIS
ncbi:hypothetical protein ACQ4PT_035437 [Festuca glaucescens]